MIAHSISKRTAKALPQVESTVYIEGVTAKVIKCTARKAFSVGNSHVAEGETFFLVRSERRENRYYVVHFNTSRATYQCSCGCNMCEHEHLKVGREHVMTNVVMPAKAEVVPMTVPATVAEVKAARQAKDEQETRKLTAADWKEIMRKDKIRQRQEKDADWAKILEARAQARREMEVVG